MVEDRRYEEELSVMKRTDVEEIPIYRVGGIHLLSAPQYSGIFVVTGAGCGHAHFWDCHEENGLVENKVRNLEVGVGKMTPPGWCIRPSRW